MEDAVRIIGRQDPDFADLCGEPQTVASLAVLISQEDDEFLKKLMVFWYNYLLIQHGFPVTYSNTSDYVSYTLTLPGGKTIDALLYTGNSTPDTYANASSYTSAILLSLSSYRYNCHSYAWYLHGDINSQSRSFGLTTILVLPTQHLPVQPRSILLKWGTLLLTRTLKISIL